MDYFKEILIDTSDDELYMDEDGFQRGRRDVDEIWNNDVEAYRQYSIKQYNSNEDRATDRFCLNMFLNTYSIAINVFGLHSELNAKASFNRLINMGWMVYREYE